MLVFPDNRDLLEGRKRLFIIGAGGLCHSHSVLDGTVRTHIVGAKGPTMGLKKPQGNKIKSEFPLRLILG